jgi:hypothetical protein
MEYEMTRAAAKAAELADRATRLANNRKEFSYEPDAVASRLLRLIDKIGKLDDTAAGDAKQTALSDAWAAYHLVQHKLDNPNMVDTAHREIFDTVDDTVAAADFDGYAESRLDCAQIASDTAYEGWPEGYSDWN